MSSAGGRLIGGRYRLEEPLGRGGMGTVWRARDEVLTRDVAVKELLFPPGLTAQDQEVMRRRTMREARTAARLSHPGVVRIYDVVEDEERPWIVMELLPSARSLSEILADEGTLPPARAARIGLDVLAGLAAAHSAGVLHRDVKPGNILITADDRAVLGDFGIAVAEEEPTLTRSGMLIGSPAFLSPEQARGAELTPASDLWSLGATLFTLVEGRTPFHRDNVMATLTAIITDEPEPARRAGPLRPVIDGLLRKDPGERPDLATVTRLLTGAAAEPGAETAAPAPAAPGGEAPERTAVLHKLPVGPPEDRTAGGPPPALAPVDDPSAAGGSTAPGPAGPAGPAPVREPGRARGDAGDGGSAPAAEPGRAGRGGLRDGTAPHGRGRPGVGTEPVRRRGRRGWFAAAAAVLVLAAGVTALAIDLAGTRHHAATTGAHRTPRSTAGSTGGATRSPGGSASAHRSPAPGGSAGPAVPAGFQRYRDPSGFSIAVPRGWRVAHDGGYVYVRDPGSARYLLIDQTTHPKDDPLADWRQQDAYRRQHDDGYRRIGLRPVSGYFDKAADLEFTHDGDGGRTHVLNRNIRVDDHHAYALYWSVPDASWARSRHYFETFAATFRPAP